MRKYKNGIKTRRVIKTRSVVHVKFKRRRNSSDWLNSRVVVSFDPAVRHQYLVNQILGVEL